METELPQNLAYALDVIGVIAIKEKAEAQVQTQQTTGQGWKPSYSGEEPPF